MANGHNLFVGFDLVHPMDNYERLARTLATLGSAVKISSMLWYVDAARGARDVEAALKTACNPGDSLIVIDASTNFTILHNLPVPGAKLRQLWNSGSQAPVVVPQSVPSEPRRPQ
jgi:hypothetical protein